MIFVVIIVCVLLAVGVYFGLTYSGVLPDAQDQGRARGQTTRDDWAGSSNGMFGIFPRVPHLRELPQGCLIALIIAATLWFIAWMVILVLALGLLRSAT